MNNEHNLDLDDQVPATNCLEGIRCPKCGFTAKFEIVAECTVITVDNGTDESYDFEWNDRSAIRCSNCSHAGTVGEFRAPEELMCIECGQNVFISIEGTAHHWNKADDPLSDSCSYIDHDADADHVAVPEELVQPINSDSSDTSSDPCIFTGAAHESRHDCTTHPHQSDVISVSPNQLRGGETIVGDAGGTLSISGQVYESSAMRGFYAIENEFGTLYLDSDMPVRILSDD